MNSNIKYLTSASFLIILQLLIIKELWILSLIFGMVTIVYLLLEFNGMRPKYFFRTSAIVLFICVLTIQNYFFTSELVAAHLKYLSDYSNSTLIHYVYQGLGILRDIL